MLSQSKRMNTMTPIVIAFHNQNERIQWHYASLLSQSERKNTMTTLNVIAFTISQTRFHKIKNALSNTITINYIQATRGCVINRIKKFCFTKHVFHHAVLKRNKKYLYATSTTSKSLLRQTRLRLHPCNKRMRHHQNQKVCFTKHVFHHAVS